MIALFKAFIFLFIVISWGFVFSKIGKAITKKEGVDSVIWIVWLFLAFGVFLGGDFSATGYRPN